MLVASALRPSIHWGTRLLGAQLRSGAFFRAGLAAVALVVAGRVFDLFAFTPDPIRAGLLGSQTGAFVGVLWAIGTPTALGAYRDPDDGWSMTLRSSLAGASGLWWGAWGAQIITGGALLLLSIPTLAPPSAVPAPSTVHSQHNALTTSIVNRES